MISALLRGLKKESHLSGILFFSSPLTQLISFCTEQSSPCCFGLTEIPQMMPLKSKKRRKHSFYVCIYKDPLPNLFFFFSFLLRNKENKSASRGWFAEQSPVRLDSRAQPCITSQQSRTLWSVSTAGGNNMMRTGLPAPISFFFSPLYFNLHLKAFYKRFLTAVVVHKESVRTYSVSS